MIISSKFFPPLFLDFLGDLSTTFKKSSSDPQCRFAYAYSLLQGWTSDNYGNFVARFPTRSFLVDLTSSNLWIRNFNIAPLDPYFIEVWEGLLSGTGVLIIGPNPEVATSATIAAMALIDPIEYHDQFILFTQEGDSNFQKITDPAYFRQPNGSFTEDASSQSTFYKSEVSSSHEAIDISQNYLKQPIFKDTPIIFSADSSFLEPNDDFHFPKVVGTTSKSPLLKQGQFRTIITINQTMFPLMGDIQEKFQLRTLKLFKFFLAVMNQALSNDPLADILEHPLMYSGNYHLSKKNDAEFIRNICHTQTFKTWRSRQIYRPELREAILSFDPNELSQMPETFNLEKVFDALTCAYNNAGRDYHYKLILKQDLEKIKKRMDKELPK